MNSGKVLEDPVFQLNLLLWMAKKQPKDQWRVNPFFHEQGFEVVYIEQPFKFPDEMFKQLQDAQNSGMQISLTPEPDIILAKMDQKKALYFEAKINSHGPDSSSSRQTRSHLVACGPVFAEVLKPLEKSLLCYVLPKDKCKLMDKCLLKLSNELKRKKLKPGPFSTQGLSQTARGIEYVWDDKFQKYLGVKNKKTLVLKDIKEDTDPSPLILIYTDEDSHNAEMKGFYRRVMLEKVRACLLCELHKWDQSEIFRISPEDILHKTTQDVFKYLSKPRQNRMSALILHGMFTKIVDYWKLTFLDAISLSRGVLEIKLTTRQQKDQLCDWLEDKKTKFTDEKKPLESTPLFEGLE